MTGEFVHLHVHTEYSLLDGANRIDAVVGQAARLGMPALAVTDHGAMYGAMEFYKACRDQGIKPIIGVEAYVAPRSRFDKTARVDDEPYHFVLLARNMTGYRNLTKLVSKGFLEGFYYRPRIDRELIAEHTEGLVALSGCLGAEVPQLILQERLSEAEEAAAFFRDVFGPGHFFLELQDHGLETQQTVNRELLRLAKRLGVGVVATNDAHYLERDDATAHDLLLCIQTASNLDDPKRLRFPTDAFYLKSPAEMARLFAEVPEALRNTLEVANQCHLEFEFGSFKFPRFEIPPGHTNGSYLRQLCYERLPARYGPEPSQEVLRRLEYELEMIARTGFAGYLLIVQDFVQFARQRGIPVGPGRGSAAGSLVAYVLGITDIDPLRYGLLFERFINPERVTQPDIDIDFCYERRDEVIRYVTEKYGEDSVGQIITFGTMGARAVIRDVGRALGMAYGDVDRIAKLVPFRVGMTLEHALEINPDLRRLYEEDPQVQKLIDIARSLEGLPRHPSVHAAGVVIANEPLVNYVPLARTSDGAVVTQYTMGPLEELGLLKMDFLGLRNLTVIDQTVKLVRQTRGVDLDMNRIPLDDQATFDLITRGDVLGVFQLESSGMRDMLRQLKPSTIEDVMAAVALYRPGPMENIPAFIQAKHGGQPRYLHPDLEPILRDTYGVMIYQEQIMQVASTMAGFSLGQADILRRAVGKKKKEILDEQREAFVEGCLRQGHSRKLAEELYELILKFANYGFNRAHSAAYGLIAYQTAYLKTHFPPEYMAALLTSITASTEKVAEYVEDCRRMGLRILPPDVNESVASFTVVDGGIRFGLAAVKNAGRPAIESIVRARQAGGPFASLQDFCERVDTRLLNRRAIESLIKAGAFDTLGARRSQLMAALDKALDQAHQVQRQRASGQVSFFSDDAFRQDFAPAEEALPDLAEFPHEMLLAMEKEVLGLYLSGHPLDQYRDLLARVHTVATSRLGELEEGQWVSLGGLVAARKKITTRAGEPMCFVTLEDLAGSCEVVVFPRTYESAAAYLEKDRAVYVRGRVQDVEEQPKVVAEEVLPLEEAPRNGDAGPGRAPGGEANGRRRRGPAGGNGRHRGSGGGKRPNGNRRVFLRLVEEAGAPHALELLKAILVQHPGDCPVYLHFPTRNKTIRARPEYWVDGSEALVRQLESVLGTGAVRLG